MKWEVEFFHDKVEKEISNWPAGIQATFIRIAELLELYGPFEVGMPKIENFGSGLLQIRAKGREGIGRAFFCLAMEKKIIILHGFIKKSAKTPLKELMIAKKRMKEAKKYEYKTNIF